MVAIQLKKTCKSVSAGIGQFEPIRADSGIGSNRPIPDGDRRLGEGGLGATAERDKRGGAMGQGGRHGEGSEEGDVATGDGETRAAMGLHSDRGLGDKATSAATGWVKGRGRAAVATAIGGGRWVASGRGSGG